MKKLFILVMTMLSGALGIRAQPAENAAGHGLSLKECIAAVLEQNPLVLSSHEQYRASLARIQQAKAIPQPTFGFDSDLQPGFFNFADAGESYVGITQSIEFPGKRSLRGKIATRESQAIETDIELLKLDLIFQVKRVFYGLLLAREKLKYAQQNLELSRDFLQKATYKFEAGDVAKVEVLRAQVESSKAASEVKIAENEVTLARALLNFLMARKKYEPLEITGSLKNPFFPLTLEELKIKAFYSRPEIKRASHALEKEKLVRKQGIMSYFPDFDLGIARHRIDGEPTTWDVTLSFPVPVFFWQPRKGEIAEAEANLESLQYELEHLKNAIGLEVEEAFVNAVSAQDQIRLFEEELVTQAEEVYNMFLFSYQEGEIGSIELIEARRTLVETNKSYADVLYHHEIALAALEKSIGQSLEEPNHD